jgi:hypothetical protein
MKKLFAKIFVLSLLSSFITPNISFAQSVPDPAFNPNMLIPDEAFADVGTFGSAAGIQKFLEQKGSVLANTSPEFLIKLKEVDTLTKVGLEDPQPNLSRLRTAAELIYDAGTKWGLNPQVILVTLQKEQSLINGSFNDTELTRALDRAMGFGCPDYEGCGDIFLGFYRQIFGTFDSEGNRWLGASASLMRSFRTEVGGMRVGRGPMVDAGGRTFGRPVVRTSRVGDTITFDNTLGGYAGISQQQSVTLGNAATAALYRYTPHVFNGNYNFWKFYSTWFKYPNGTVIVRLGDVLQYVVDNGTKRAFSTFVAMQRKIKTDNIITVSQTEFDSYLTEKPMPPLDGTLIKGDFDPTIYLVGDTVKHPISAPVFAQRKLSAANVITLPQAEVESYATGSYETPTNGTLIKGETTGTVYIIDAGLKRPISFAVFQTRKFSFAKLMILPDIEVTSMATGPYLTPPDMVALKTANDPTIYWFRDNMKRGVTAFVWKQRGVGNFPLLVLSEEELASISTGTLFPPRDGTVIKGDVSSAIYKMEGGLKRMFTAASYKKARYPKATVLPQGEVDGYAEGSVIN